MTNDRRLRSLAFVFAFAFLWLVSFSSVAFGHAVLIEADPPLNTQVEESPAKLRYVFNERLEKRLFYIRVFNEQGETVTDRETQMSDDQKEISLALPPLPDGMYTVTYHIVSADGHPVEQSGYLMIGGSTEQPSSWYMMNVANSEHHGGISIDRMLYYSAFLSLSGWVAWGIFFSFKSESNRTLYRQWLQRFRHFFFISLLVTGIIQFASLLRDWGIVSLIPEFMRSLWGWSWLISFALALLSYAMLRRTKWLDGAWIGLLAIIEGLNGHAMTFHPTWLSVGADIVHVIVALIWVGGLWFFFVYWKPAKEEMLRFYPMFSRAALISMIVATITGSLLGVLFIPKGSYLFQTAWGALLLIKVAFVVGVIWVAGLIQTRVKRGQTDQLHRLLRIDFMLMALIVIVVGALTYVNPLPQNKPLYWDERRPSVHLVTQITPKAPGNNRITVRAKMMNPDLDVKQVEVSLVNRDGKIAPIQADMERLATESGDEDAVFVAEGHYIPFAGDWTVEVRARDTNDDERMYSKDITVYDSY